MSLICLCLLYFLIVTFCSFHCQVFQLLWLNLFLRILLFFGIVNGIAFLISFSKVLLLVYRNTTFYVDFFILQLLRFFISSNRFLGMVFRYFLYVSSCLLQTKTILLLFLFGNLSNSKMKSTK